MFESLKKTSSFIVLPISEGSRWVTNEEYAIKIPVESMHLTEMMMVSGEYEYDSNDQERGKFLRDSFPDMNVLLTPKEMVSKAEIVSTEDTIKRPDTGDTVQTVSITSDTRTKAYGKNDVASFDKSLFVSIIDIHPNTDIYLGERLDPLIFVKAGHEYKMENVVAFLSEIVSWYKEG